MATPVSPVPQILTIHGDALVVQLRNVPGVPNEVALHITRNGLKEDKFSLLEMSQIVTKLQGLLGRAQAHVAVSAKS